MAFLPDQPIWEILTWLPAKSLMRFKTVSKLWLSTILDPTFAQAHRGPVRGLLTIGDADDPPPVNSYRGSTHTLFYLSLPVLYRKLNSSTQLNRNLIYVNLDGSDSRSSAVDVSIQFPIPKDLRSFKTTNLMNGLLCFYDRNISVLFNVATRERISLPSACEGTRHDRSNPNYTYHLGFDPIHNLYKLIRIFKGGIHDLECDILTLGMDSSWRSIGRTPREIKFSSVIRTFYSNGEIYWLLMWRQYSCVSFNLATEKFNLGNKWKEPYMVLSDENCLVSHGPVCDTKAEVLVADGEFIYSDGKPCNAFLPYGMRYMYFYGHRIWSNVEYRIFLYDKVKRNTKKIVLRNLHEVLLGSGQTLGWYKENVISLRQFDCWSI